jgi:hypothetical protein
LYGQSTPMYSLRRQLRKPVAAGASDTAAPTKY